MLPDVSFLVIRRSMKDAKMALTYRLGLANLYLDRKVGRPVGSCERALDVGSLNYRSSEGLVSGM
jgi:hypothetical protein